MAIWRVLRQDDNGNIFLVADSLCEDAARRLAAELEARAHKQLYFVERAGAPSHAGPACAAIERAPEAAPLSPGSCDAPPAPPRKP